MVDFRRIKDRAKDVVEKRGGSESLKRDAEELRGIAKGPGTLKDKAKAAVSAIKEPGATHAETETEPTAAAQTTTEERARAEAKVADEHRGKHAEGGAGAQRDKPGGDGGTAV